MNYQKWINEHQTEMTATLQKWVSIPSVADAAEEGAPYGREVRRALDTALADAEAMGLEAHNYDGMAGDVRIGSGATEDALAMLCHLDVVPVGDGWTKEPFGAALIDGRVYGRGTSDDKGPAVAALYAMKAVAEAGVPLKRQVRLILGCNEECGDWEDIAYYTAKAGMPRMGFSPDAEYPVINTEKGILHLSGEAAVPADGLTFQSFWVGERSNVIPGIASCVINGDKALADKALAAAERLGYAVTAAPEGSGWRLTAQGVSGHAANPEKAKNALGMLLQVAAAIGAEGVWKSLAQKIGLDYTGAGLGVACSDGVSGPLTMNMGILHLADGKITFSLDIRHPILASAEAIEAAIRKALPEVSFKVDSCSAPHHVPAESPLVQALLAAYEEQTGQKGEAIAIGGGTYAKCLEEGVAFGAQFPGTPELAHQADEFMSVADLMKNVSIYIAAILKIAG